MVGPMSVKKNVIKLKLPKRKLQNFQLYKRQQDLRKLIFKLIVNTILWGKKNVIKL